MVKCYDFKLHSSVLRLQTPKQWGSHEPYYQRSVQELSWKINPTRNLSTNIRPFKKIQKYLLQALAIVLAELLPHNSTASNIRSNHKQGNDKIKLFALFNRHITKLIVGLQSHNNPKTSLDTLILDWISEQSRITRNLTAHKMIFSNNSRTGHNLK